MEKISQYENSEGLPYEVKLGTQLKYTEIKESLGIGG